MLIVEDTSKKEKFVIKDNITKERITTLRDHIVETGMVSKGDILSIEEFIGSDFISSTHDIKRMSLSPSSISAGKISRSLQEYLDNNEDNETIDVKKVDEGLTKLTRQLETVVNYISNINPENLGKLEAHFALDKHRLRYDSNDHLINIYTEGDVTEFIDTLYDGTSGINDLFNPRFSSTSGGEVVTLLDILIHPEKLMQYTRGDYIYTDFVTLEQITNLLLNPHPALNRLKAAVREAQDEFSTVLVSDFYGVDDLKKVNGDIHLLQSLLGDELSLALLRLYN